MARPLPLPKSKKAAFGWRSDPAEQPAKGSGEAGAVASPVFLVGAVHLQFGDVGPREGVDAMPPIEPVVSPDRRGQPAGMEDAILGKAVPGERERAESLLFLHALTRGFGNRLAGVLGL